MEHNSWKKEKDLGNVGKLVVEFKKRMNAEIRKQEKLYLAEKKDFRRRELPRKYTVKILYG